MLGLFGGSFDPVHFGHIKLAHALLDDYDFEKIIFIPCAHSPLKGKTFTDARHRLAMLNIVIKSNQKFVIDDRELKRIGPSYTIDTLIELREEVDVNQSLVLLMGVDAFLKFCKWYKYDEILSYCHIMLLQRPGYNIPDKGCEYNYYKNNYTQHINKLSALPNGLIFLCENLKFDVSSSEIRQNLSEGKQPRYLIPGNVWNYIKRNNLYN